METDLKDEIEEEECSETINEELIPSECDVALRTEPNYLQEFTKQLEIISSRLIEGLVKVNTTVTNLDHQLSQEMCNLSAGIDARFYDLVERQEVLEDRVVRFMTEEFDERDQRKRMGQSSENRREATEVREEIHRTNPISTRSGDKSTEKDLAPFTRATVVDLNGKVRTSIAPEPIGREGLRRSLRLKEKYSLKGTEPSIREVSLSGPPLRENEFGEEEREKEQGRSVKSRSLGYSHKQEDLAPSLEYTDSDFKNGDEENNERTEVEKRLVTSRNDPEHISNMSGRVPKLNGDRQEREGRREQGRKFEEHRYHPRLPNSGPPNQLGPRNTISSEISSSFSLTSVRNFVPPVDVNPDNHVFGRALVEGNNTQNDVRNWETPPPTLRPTVGALPVLAHQFGTVFPILFVLSY